MFAFDYARRPNAPGAVYFKFSPGTKGDAGVLDAVLNALDPYGQPKGNLNQKLDRILGLLKPGDMLIADECGIPAEKGGRVGMNRKAVISMIHMGAARMGWDDEARRGWMEKQTGKRSCTDCSDTELSRLADALRLMGALRKPGAARKSGVGVVGGTGADRPTPNQWKTALGIARDLGMSGEPDDPALVTFVQRQAKVTHPRFLDRAGMSKVITGLRKWLDPRLPATQPWRCSAPYRPGAPQEPQCANLRGLQR